MERDIIVSRGQSLAIEPGRGTQQWEKIMRKFSQTKTVCEKIKPNQPLLKAHRSLKTFPTGSTYEGTWDQLGMSGEGTYTFPFQGVVYKGHFQDGVFHGRGELQYESGAIIRGKWDKGKLIERHLFFSDGLEYSEENWAYCRYPDRRFKIEYNEGIKPADQSYETAVQPPPEIPPGYYDVCDGLYHPETKSVYKYDDLSAIVRAPQNTEQKWIKDNCRTMPDDVIGPRPYLYEQWMEPVPVLPDIPLPLLNTEDIRDTESLHKKSSKGLFSASSRWDRNKDFYNPDEFTFDQEDNDRSRYAGSKLTAKPSVKSSTVIIKDQSRHYLVKNKTSEWGLAPTSEIGHMNAESNIAIRNQNTSNWGEKRTLAELSKTNKARIPETHKSASSRESNTSKKSTKFEPAAISVHVHDPRQELHKSDWGLTPDESVGKQTKIDTESNIAIRNQNTSNWSIRNSSPAVKMSKSGSLKDKPYK